MAKNYLDQTGLALVWAKIKELVSTKVDKVEGKGLSSNDYTSDEKTKLAGIASGAQVNVLEGIQKNGNTVTITNKIANISVPTKTSDITNDSGYITSSSVPTATTTTPKMDGTASVGTETKWAKGDHVHPSDTTKVDKVDGKGLSTNDYTTTEKNKLNGIASGAQVNVIETIKVNNTALTPSSKTVNVTVPTKTSDITNDSGFITISDVPEGAVASTTTPNMDGTASAGTEVAFARGDHVHPSDTTKVDKVTGKGLSTNDYTDAEKTKLGGIATGAEVNQNAFANITVGSTTIQADAKQDTLTFVAGDNITLTPDSTNDKITITATDTTYTAASATPNMDGTAAVGTSAKYAREDHVHPSDTTRVPTSRKINGKALSSNITLSASDVSAIPTSEKGAADGVCPLNSSMIIDSIYLPSFVDDVIEAYPRSSQTELSSTWLAKTPESQAPEPIEPDAQIIPQSGVIYVLMADSTNYSANSQFRWGGSSYVKLNDGGVSPITNEEINTICV